jgi:ribosomal protein L34E
MPKTEGIKPWTDIPSDSIPIFKAYGFAFDPVHFPFTLLSELTKIAQELRADGLEKTGKNSHSNYRFFEESELAKHLTKLFNDHGIGYAAGAHCITGREELYKTNSGNTMWNHSVEAAVIFSHLASREWIAVPGVGEGADTGDKSVTKAITSAIKYIQMKTFLVSEGNDAEQDQDSSPKQSSPGSSTKTQQSKSQTTKKSTVKNKCHDCTKEIFGIKNNGKEIPAEVIAAKSMEKFGMYLCANCAMKKRGSPAAKQAPKGTPAKKTQIIETSLAEAPTKRMIVVKKGKDEGKKKPIYDLVLFDGMKVSDWSASHYDYYAEASEGAHIKINVEEKQSGRYINRDVIALMEIGDLCVEDEDGNPVDTGVESDGAEAEDAPDFEGATDEDIPF